MQNGSRRVELWQRVELVLDLVGQVDSSCTFMATIEMRSKRGRGTRWELAIEKELDMLEAGDEINFDLHNLLATEKRLVAKLERFAAAVIRYASVTYGS